MLLAAEAWLECMTKTGMSSPQAKQTCNLLLLEHLGPFVAYHAGHLACLQHRAEAHWQYAAGF